MKNNLLIALLVLFAGNSVYSQNKSNGLGVEDTKFSLGISAPFGGQGYVMNVVNRWGGFVSIMSVGSQPREDDNYISEWHVLRSEYAANQFNFSVGAVYRVWKPFHVYLGTGLGWTNYQLIYVDTPPVVLPDAYRIRSEKFKLLANAGVLFSIWRITLGVGYDTHIGKPIYSFGYTIKVPTN